MNDPIIAKKSEDLRLPEAHLDEALSGAGMPRQLTGPEEWARLSLQARENPAFEIERLDKPTAEATIRELEKKFADYLISQIDQRRQLEAQVGRGHAIVMSLVLGEIKPPGGIQVYGLAQPEWLVGAARQVWDYCVNGPDGKGPDLKPTLEYWDDGVGKHSGFNIVAHFEPEKTPVGSDMVSMVLQQIPERAQLEARLGRRHAVIMGIPSTDIDTSHKDWSRDVLTPEMLKGAARDVFEHCKGENGAPDLKPTLEYWDDGKGGAGGFNIVIHW
jgi:hypothetical protein